MTPRNRPALALALFLVACTSDPPKKPKYEPPRPAPPVTAGTAGPEVAAVPPVPEVATGGTAESAADPLPAGAADGDAVLVTVDGESITVRELLAFWMHRDSRQVYGYVQALIERRIIQIESRRLGIVLDSKLVDDAVTDVTAEILARIEEGDPELGFEDYLRGRLGLDPVRYRETLRQDRVHTLTFERVVRGWQMAQERARVRLIICLEEDPVEEIQAALDAGRPFADVAQEFSRDPSREQGGLMAPVVRTENMLLSRLAFSTAVGEVTGPVEDRGSVLWLLVEDFPEPVTGLWAEIATPVEASLAEQSLDELEVLQWQQATLPFHDIDNASFFRLVGEPITE